jgi:hypothetical protein
MAGDGNASSAKAPNRTTWIRPGQPARLAREGPRAILWDPRTSDSFPATALEGARREK